MDVPAVSAAHRIDAVAQRLLGRGFGTDDQTEQQDTIRSVEEVHALECLLRVIVVLPTAWRVQGKAIALAGAGAVRGKLAEIVFTDIPHLLERLRKECGHPPGHVPHQWVKPVKGPVEK